MSKSIFIVLSVLLLLHLHVVLAVPFQWQVDRRSHRQGLGSIHAGRVSSSTASRSPTSLVVNQQGVVSLLSSQGDLIARTVSSPHRSLLSSAIDGALTRAVTASLDAETNEIVLQGYAVTASAVNLAWSDRLVVPASSAEIISEPTVSLQFSDTSDQAFVYIIVRDVSCAVRNALSGAVVLQYKGACSAIRLASVSPPSAEILLLNTENDNNNYQWSRLEQESKITPLLSLPVLHSASSSSSTSSPSFTLIGTRLIALLSHENKVDVQIAKLGSSNSNSKHTSAWSSVFASSSVDSTKSTQLLPFQSSFALLSGSKLHLFSLEDASSSSSSPSQKETKLLAQFDDVISVSPPRSFSVSSSSSSSSLSSLVFVQKSETDRKSPLLKLLNVQTGDARVISVPSSLSSLSSFPISSSSRIHSPPHANISSTLSLARVIDFSSSSPASSSSSSSQPRSHVLLSFEESHLISLSFSTSKSSDANTKSSSSTSSSSSSDTLPSLVNWHREEGLSELVDCIFTDLPPDTSASLLSDYFSLPSLLHASHQLLHNVKSSLLSAFPFVSLLSSASSSSSSSSSAVESTNSADRYGLERSIVCISKSGVVYSLNTLSGSILWRSSPFSSSSSSSSSFSSARLISLSNHGVLVLSHPSSKKEKEEEGTELALVDRDTGRVLNRASLPYRVVLTRTLHSHQDAAVLLVHQTLPSREYHAELFPNTPEALRLAEASLSEIVFFVADKSHASGYKLRKSSTTTSSFSSQLLWTVSVSSSSQSNTHEEEIVSVVSNDELDALSDETVRLSNGEILRKFLSPSVLILVQRKTSSSTPPSSSSSSSSTSSSPVASSSSTSSSSVRVMRVEAHTGAVLSSHSHSHSIFRGGNLLHEPIGVLNENWHSYVYWNTRLQRYEMTVVELYDRDNNTKADSVDDVIINGRSLSSSLSYVLPVASFGGLEGGSAVALSQTRHSISPRVLLLGTMSGQIISVERRFLDAKRKLKEQYPQAELAEGMVIPYHPVLPLPAITSILTTNSSLSAPIRLLRCSRAHLESVSHLVALSSSDLYYAQMNPAGGSFDRLQTDFGFAALALTLGGLTVATLFLSRYSKIADIERQWK